MLLEVKNLRAGYGPTQVLVGPDFAVAEVRVTALLVANVLGKTTPSSAVSGIIRPVCLVLLACRPITRLYPRTTTRLRGAS